MWAAAQIIQNNSLRKALSEHKALGIEDPQGFASAAQLSSLLSPLSFHSLPLPPCPLSFLHSDLQQNQSELRIALFSADLHVRESRVIGV